MGKKKAILSVGTIGSALFAVVLAAFCAVNYIDLSVVAIIYLPIWIVAIVGIVSGKWVFGAALLASSSIGLVAEYIVHVSKPMQPSMQGAFLNTGIIAVGVLVGIVAELAKGRNTMNP